MTTTIGLASEVSSAHLGHACGKAILLGEHSVVLGAPALVASLPDGMIARDGGSADALSVSVESWSLRAEADPKGNLACQALAALDESLAAAGISKKNRTRLVEVETRIPPRSGLGSSAALAICVGRLIASRAGRDDLIHPRKSAELANGSEKIFHGLPSGVDAAAAAAPGGIGAFARTLGLTPVEQPSILHLLVASTGERPPSREMVEHVSRLATCDPDARRYLYRMGDLASAGAFHIARKRLRELGEAMYEAHELLSRLGVSTEALDVLVSESKRTGALGAKLTGAGGGGCVVTLCSEETIEPLLARLEAIAKWTRHFAIEPSSNPRNNGTPSLGKRPTND